MNVANELIYVIHEKFIYNYLQPFRKTPIQEISPNVLNVAFKYNFFHLLVSDNTTLDWAASKGYLAIVQWLYSHSKIECGEWAINWAAANGHLQVIQWLHANNKCIHDTCIKWNTFAIDIASKGGHLGVVEWLAENGYKCTSSAMDLAAGGGHLDILKFLKQHFKVNFTKKSFELAERGGHAHVLEWLNSQQR